MGSAEEWILPNRDAIRGWLVGQPTSLFTLSPLAPRYPTHAVICCEVSAWFPLCLQISEDKQWSLNLFSSLLFPWVLLTGVLRWVQILYLLLVYLSMNTYWYYVSVFWQRGLLWSIWSCLWHNSFNPLKVCLTVLSNHVLMFRKPLWLKLLSDSPSNLCLRKIGNADFSGRKTGVAFSLGCLSPTEYV